MTTIYETRNGQITDANLQAFIEKVEKQGSAATPVHYHKIKTEGDKRLIMYNGLICLDPKCGCGGWHNGS